MNAGLFCESCAEIQSSKSRIDQAWPSIRIPKKALADQPLVAAHPDLWITTTSAQTNT